MNDMDCVTSLFFKETANVMRFCSFREVEDDIPMPTLIDTGQGNSKKEMTSELRNIF